MIEWAVFIAAIFYFLTIYFIVKRIDDINSKVDVLWQRQSAQHGWLPREY